MVSREEQRCGLTQDRRVPARFDWSKTVMPCFDSHQLTVRMHIGLRGRNSQRVGPPRPWWAAARPGPCYASILLSALQRCSCGCLLVQ